MQNSRSCGLLQGNFLSSSHRIIQPLKKPPFANHFHNSVQHLSKVLCSSIARTLQLFYQHNIDIGSFCIAFVSSKMALIYSSFAYGQSQFTTHKTKKPPRVSFIFPIKMIPLPALLHRRTRKFLILNTCRIRHFDLKTNYFSLALCQSQKRIFYKRQGSIQYLQKVLWIKPVHDICLRNLLVEKWIYRFYFLL
jgi:hypothetical protein